MGRPKEQATIRIRSALEFVGLGTDSALVALGDVNINGVTRSGVVGITILRGDRSLPLHERADHLNSVMAAGEEMRRATSAFDIRYLKKETAQEIVLGDIRTVEALIVDRSLET